MKGKLGVTVALMSVVVGVTSVLADSTHHRTHHKRVLPAATSDNLPSGSSFEPPRMIEARPGVWISTYDCITDDGYGRWFPCSAGAHNR